MAHQPTTVLRRPLLLLLCCLLLGVTATTAPGQDEEATDAVDLRPIWTEGQTARYEVRTTRVTTSRNPQGESRQRTVDITATVTWTVTDADDAGGGTATMRTDDMKIVLAADEERYEITPDRVPEDLKPIGELVKAYTAHPVTVTVDESGRVTEVADWQRIRDAAGVAGEAMTENDFIEMASELAPLAGGAADRAPGEEWTESFDFSHEFGDMKLSSEYTFAGVETIAEVPIALVNRESEIDYTVNRERTGMDQSNADFSIDWRVTDAEQSAQIMFDLTRQEVVGMNLDRTLAFEITTRIGDRTNTGTMTEQLNTQILRVAEE